MFHFEIACRAFKSWDVNIADLVLPQLLSQDPQKIDAMIVM
jgi:hypothetical protein